MHLQFAAAYSLRSTLLDVLLRLGIFTFVRANTIFPVTPSAAASVKPTLTVTTPSPSATDSFTHIWHLFQPYRIGTRSTDTYSRRSVVTRFGARSGRDSHTLMASQGGLTRRRGAGGGGVTSPDGDDESSSSRVTSPIPRQYPDRTPETAYESSENGHKIAYDPRDISENAERSKQPKLTLMEEILLLGLKDKQVTKETHAQTRTTLMLARATCPSGMTISHTPCEDA